MGRACRILAATSLVALTCGAGLTSVSARAAQRVPLPTQADLVALAPGAETILYGPKGIETMIPGPVEDQEVVTVAVGPDGIPTEVGVKQRLVVHGLGDFRFKVSGPAQTVEALPDSESEPGLRKGAVLWQGFSADQKVLSSKMLLFPDQEATRLPLQVSFEQTVDGRAPEGPATGRLSARIRVTNRSASPVTITSARGDPAELAGTLDALAVQLAARDRPVPGSDGVPDALTSLGGERSLTRDVPASFRISGTLSFEGGRLDDALAEGGRVEARGAGPLVIFDGFVGRGRAGTLNIALDGVAHDLGRPVLNLVARPAPPPADAARPPDGGTWTDLVDAGRVEDTRPLWNRIMMLTWRVAKLRQFDSYMGNPDPTGPVSTVYQFRLAGPAPAADPIVDRIPRPKTTRLLAATAILAVLLLLLDGVMLWSLL